MGSTQNLGGEKGASLMLKLEGCSECNLERGEGNIRFGLH
jgi:hypothetical protein